MINQLKNQLGGLAFLMVTTSLLSASKASASADGDYSFIIDSDWHNCYQIGTDYQEVYAFETPSFYVNICQKDEFYFYSGESKQSDRTSIFIPAQPLENHRGYRAENGNLSYVVILPFSEPNAHNSSPLEPAEAILTIKRNGQLVAVESSLNKYCQKSAIAFVLDDLKLSLPTSHQLATIPHDLGWSLSSSSTEYTPSSSVFDSRARFDFYRIDDQLHRLVTCN